MEYAVIGLLVALFIVLCIKQPKTVSKLLTNTAVSVIRENEADIVQGLYNKLPAEIKNKVDSKTIATVVGFAIGVTVDVLEESVQAGE